MIMTATAKTQVIRHVLKAFIVAVALNFEY
jgi:hypothetical protein